MFRFILPRPLFSLDSLPFVLFIRFSTTRNQLLKCKSARSSTGAFSEAKKAGFGAQPNAQNQDSLTYIVLLQAVRIGFVVFFVNIGAGGARIYWGI